MLCLYTVKTKNVCGEINNYDNKNEAKAKSSLNTWEFQWINIIYLFQNTQLHVFPGCPEQLHCFIMFSVHQYDSIDLRKEIQKKGVNVCSMYTIVCIFITISSKRSSCESILPPGSCHPPAIFHQLLPFHLFWFWTQICRCHSQHKAGPHLQRCWSPSLRKKKKHKTKIKKWSVI